MGPIYTSRTTFTAQAADPVVVAIPATTRGRVRTLRVLAQPAGSLPASFTYALYSSGAAFTSNALTATSELYRVTPDRTVSGAAIDSGGFSLDYPFQNQDGTPNLRLSSLYLHISGLGTTTAFTVVLMVEQPVLNG